jgi:hypothetical protein
LETPKSEATWCWRRRLRWSAGAVSIGFVTAGILNVAEVGSPAGATVSAGQGSASAQAIAIQPHEGSLATGVVMGEALAGHTGNYARGQSQGVDLGAIGLSLKGYDCSNLTPAQGGPVPPSPSVANSVPTALEVETPPGGGQAEKSIGAQQGYYMQNTGNSTSNPSQAPPPPTYGWTESALANGVPYADAQTTLVQSIDASLVSVSDVSSKAWSGLVDGQREAGATVDIGSLNIGAGSSSVSLSGLQWSAVYPSGGSAKPSANFSIGKLMVGGLAVPTTQNPSAIQALIDKALAPLGMEANLPSVSTDSTSSSVSISPLQLAVVPNSNRDTLLNSALNPFGPATNQLFLDLENGFPGEPNSLLDVLCRSDSAITVLDITLASVTGGGYASASFGGVTASSSDLAANPFHLSLFASGGLSASQTQFIPGTAGTSAGGQAGGSATPSVVAPSAPAASGGTGSGSPSGTSPAGGTTQSYVPASAGEFGGGGPLLAIGLGGLALVGLLAEADRRMMRRALHTATFEE